MHILTITLNIHMSVLAKLDLCSAVDTIDHSIHVHRLHTDIGFTDTVLQWLSSYLTDRIQYVYLSNHFSAFVPVRSCVPQGSVLGPIRFSVHIKPLSAIIDSHSITHHSLLILTPSHIIHYWFSLHHTSFIIDSHSITHHSLLILTPSHIIHY